jgi:hypothetical protein
LIDVQIVLDDLAVIAAAHQPPVGAAFALPILATNINKKTLMTN